MQLRLGQVVIKGVHPCHNSCHDESRDRRHRGRLPWGPLSPARTARREGETSPPPGRCGPFCRRPPGLRCFSEGGPSRRAALRRWIFVASLEGTPRPYKLRVKLHDGSRPESKTLIVSRPLLSEFELHLHGEGTHYESYNTLGAHLVEVEGVEGVRFAVWAPNAEVVSVVGDFNEWDTRRHPMRLRTGGVWEIFLPGVGEGAQYKYFVRSRQRATGR